MQPDWLLAVFAAVFAILILKMQILAVATAAKRGSLGAFATPEDAAWLGGDHVTPDHPDVRRIFRSHQNDLEALLPFAVGAGLYLFSSASAVVGALYAAAFLIARLAHSVAYLGRQAALRRNAFVVSWLINIVMPIHAAAVLGMATAI